jgi:uncharacterized membrane protein YkoI
VATFVLLGAATMASADDDHERALTALEEGEVLPLTSILLRAETLLHGRLLEAELEREDGFWIYEIKLLRADGRLVEAYFDARTGELLEVEGNSGGRRSDSGE